MSNKTVFPHFQALSGSPDSFLISPFIREHLTSFSKNENIVILPGLIDLHVHLRQPGFSYKETIATGTKAAASAGYTTVCSMPNLNPFPDCPAGISSQLDLIHSDAVIDVLPYSRITVKGEKCVDFDEMVKYTRYFSDDGVGVQSEDMMLEAMKRCKAVGGIIAAHCEDNSLLHGGYIHDGEYCRTHGHKGICSESEYGQIERDLYLAEKTGCQYHVCHISCAESVDLIRKAKKKGLNVSCETAPHYLLLCDEDLQEDGRFKMNPPLRSRNDKNALLEGICDGTIEVIATDHAPHTAEEKSKGLASSLMGITGIETAFPLLYTYLVKENIISLDKLIELMSLNPRKIFSVPDNRGFCCYSLDREYTINPDDFISMGKATPFTGWKVQSKNLLTSVKGEIVWQEEK